MKFLVVLALALVGVVSITLDQSVTTKQKLEKVQTKGLEKIDEWINSTPPQSCNGWPMDKFRAQVKNWLTTNPNVKAAVYVTTGAMNPIHLGHREMFANAMVQANKKTGFHTLGGWISPSHYGYVYGKMRNLGQLYIPAEDRVKMVEETVKNHPLISAGKWESLVASGFVDFPDVHEELAEAINDDLLNLKQITGIDVAGKVWVYYVCGQDHWDRNVGYNAFTRVPKGLHGGVVASYRGGQAPAGKENVKNGVIFAPTKDSAELEKVKHASSTEIRTYIDNLDFDGLRNTEMMDPEAVNTLEQTVRAGKCKHHGKKGAWPPAQSTSQMESQQSSQQMEESQMMTNEDAFDATSQDGQSQSAVMMALQQASKK